jgi:hypothetical protein
MAKRIAMSQIVNLTPDHQKLGIALIPLHEGGMPHTIEKMLTRVTSFL